MRTSMFVTAAAAAALVASPLSAQSWQAIGTPNNTNTGAYWNNRSDDNNVVDTPLATCNAGAILTGVPVGGATATSCANQAPVYLPLASTPLTAQDVFFGGLNGANPGAFRFSAGIYNISLIGRIAGIATTPWGVITDEGTVISAATLALGNTDIRSNFALWIAQAVPMDAAGTIHTTTRSTGAVAIGSRIATKNQQFAIFTTGAVAGQTDWSADAFGTILQGPEGGEFYVGMEDNANCGRGFDTLCGQNPAGPISDRDYNDILVKVQPVPEPATIGLMGFGLLTLAGVARKRRKA
jgi:hypothetical protein